MNWKTLVYLCLLVGSLFLLNTPWKQKPSLASLASVNLGFWQNTKPIPLAQSLSHLKKLNSIQKSRFEIQLEENGVPHIFASSAKDLYFAQGFVTASDRLWQMEIQVRAASGRLSEILGSVTLQMDLQKRRFGMNWAAEKSLSLAIQNPETLEALESYSAGVNAYISTLTPKSYPLEYKLLNHIPEPWTPLKSVLMIKQMAWDLSIKSDDFRMTNNLVKFGQQVVDDLFPEFEPDLSPVISTSPGGLLTHPNHRPAYSNRVQLIKVPKFFEPNGANGSNNWAVSGSKSASRFPMLANDPHLPLKLPSIWYENQLSAPGINVYGVSIPGIPAVTIGFNTHIAWGVTNGGDDVTDWYKLKFNGEKKQKYLYKSQWKETEFRNEMVYVKGAESVPLIIPITLFGPEAIEGYALQWNAHEPSNELKAFQNINRSSNTATFQAALSHMRSPIQNFAMISNQGDIGIYHSGNIPLRLKEQGKVILNSEDPNSPWQGWLKTLPFEVNPPRGFVSSANQFPVGPSFNHPLLGSWNSTSQSRASRINDLLISKPQFDLNDFQNMLNDNKDKIAARVMPHFLKNLLPKNEAQVELVKILGEWNFYNDAESPAAGFFRLWWQNFQNMVWQDEFPTDSFQRPYADRTSRLLEANPNSHWFDNVSTSHIKETLGDMIHESFQSTYSELSQKIGPPQSKFVNWNLGTSRGTDIKHLTQIEAFGRLKLKTGGGTYSINATKRDHGPSWKMIVTFDENGPIARGIFPGGQSGHIGTPHFENFIDPWQRGELKTLNFKLTSESLPKLKSIYYE